MSAPVQVSCLWTLDLGFGTWIWHLFLGLGFGTGLGLDNSPRGEILNVGSVEKLLPKILTIRASN